MAFGRINVSEAKALIEEGAVVVDIRDPQSFSAGAIPEAIHITGDVVDKFVEEQDCTRPLIVCCYHGNASQGAAQFFDTDTDADADVTHISVNVYLFRKRFKYIVGNDADGVALLHLINDDDKLIPT